jgi:hypothetical protein
MNFRFFYFEQKEKGCSPALLACPFSDHATYEDALFGASALQKTIFSHATNYDVVNLDDHTSRRFAKNDGNWVENTDGK